MQRFGLSRKINFISVSLLIQDILGQFFPLLNCSRTELAKEAIAKLSFSDFQEQGLVSLRRLWSSGVNHKARPPSQMKHCFQSSFISMTSTIERSGGFPWCVPGYPVLLMTNLAAQLLKSLVYLAARPKSIPNHVTEVACQVWEALFLLSTGEMGRQT